jgi:hypothetical protein
MPLPTGTAAVNAPDAEAKALARREKKRAAMAAKYADSAWREAKKRSVLVRWHLLHPTSRWGTRGRLPRVTATAPSTSPTDSDDAASSASTPRSAIPAAAVILAGAAVGAAVASLF